MGKPSAEKIAQRAFDLELLNERQLQEIWAALGSRSVAVDDFLQLLVRREYMTNYQVERLVKGDRTGFFFGEYKVLYLVGTGTFARVYRAVHRTTSQVVAVKVLRNRYSESAAQFSQFVREGRVGSTLRHPNIVPTYEVFSEGKTHFLVMEFVEGRNLSEFVKIRKQIEASEATRLMIDIVSGMRYAFETGMTHRDLKMNNVLVSSRGQAKLVDFGLAAMDETLADDVLADLPNTRTIDYAALERVTSVRKDDTRSDIYFLGCIYYHMLSGQPPLTRTRDRTHRLSRARFVRVKPIRKIDPGIPDSVALVVNKAMMLDPTRRYQTPAHMLADLRIASRRLEEQAQATARRDSETSGQPAAGGSNGDGASYVPPEERPSVMVVESNAVMQDVFRNGFKRAGYRVLLTSDPDRAFGRFRENSSTAECVVINAQQLGESAVETFNHFGNDSNTNFVPAVLLLDENQFHWKKKVQTADHRIVLPMPITMKQLRGELAKLVAPKASS